MTENPSEKTRQIITPHLWYDREAAEAARLYTSIFAGSKIKSSSKLDNTPSGTVEMLTIDLSGLDVALLSAGPIFKFTPAVSFLVGCDTKGEVDSIWNELSKGGAALMELDAYPFSEWYGWLSDRYGLSWQVMFVGDHHREQKVTPVLMFVGQQCGRTEEAINFYTSVFDESEVGDITRYGSGEGPDKAGTVKHAAFKLAGQHFAAMDSAHAHDFSFTEAISFIVSCSTQEEVDYYWAKLSAVPAAEQCGWLKDRYGLSWQVVPAIMSEMLGDKDPQKIARVTEAFLKMKKFDIAALEKAYRG